MIRLRDVAVRAGVSEATASLVLNGKPGPKDETRNRVLQAAAELHYSPNAVARNLASRKTDTIGLVITDIENPFFGTVTRYVDEYVHRHGSSLILSVSNDNIQREEAIIQNFVEQRVGGIIIVPTQYSRRDFAIFDRLRDRGISLVFATNYYPDYGASRVLTDYAIGSYYLTKYLLQLGHRCVYHLVSSDPGAPISQRRVAGYRRAFEEQGLEVADEWIVPCPKPDYASGFQVSQRLLETCKPDAIIAINDVLALGAKRASLQKGLRVPEDISIAGYDDVVFASLAEIPLTTVRQNIEEICRTAIDMITFGSEYATSYPEEVLIEPELVVRGSTAQVKT